MQNNYKAKEMFIVKALEKILAEKDIKRSHHSQLKKAAEGAIASLKGKLFTLCQHYIRKIMIYYYENFQKK